MKNPQRKLIIIVVIVILAVFGLLTVLGLLVNKKENKPALTIQPLGSLSQTEKPTGILVRNESGFSWLDPKNGQVLKHISISENLIGPTADNTTSYAGGEGYQNYRVSPDGRYVAIVHPAPTADYSQSTTSSAQSQQQVVKIYNLSTGNDYQLVKAGANTEITDISWDFSGRAVSLIASKKIANNSYNYGWSPVSLFLPGSFSPPKSELSLYGIELESGRVVQRNYTPNGYRYSSNAINLVASDGNKYYIFEGTSMITVGETVVRNDTNTDWSSNYYNGLVTANDYKSVAVLSSLGGNNVLIYQLDKKRKESVDLGASGRDYSGGYFPGLALSPDGTAIAFTWGSTEQPAKQLVRNRALWYYQFSGGKPAMLNGLVNSLDNKFDNFVFSPDGQSLALSSRNESTISPLVQQEIKITSQLGGTKTETTIPAPSNILELVRWQ